MIGRVNLGDWAIERFALRSLEGDQVFNTVAALLVGIFSVAAAADTVVPVRLTQRDLVARCFNGTAVDPATRAWEVAPGPVTLAFSMRSQARAGRSVPDAGTAAVTFTAEAGHRYEVEIRADAAAFSSRSWRAGEWLPVVRDRTTDRIVSDAARWGDSACSGH